MSANGKPAFVMPPRPVCIPPHIERTAGATAAAAAPGAQRPGERRADSPAGALHAPASGAPASGGPGLPEKWVYVGDGISRAVPVSFAARDWGVTSRRIRALLVSGRLNGRRQENGYWEVYHPYRVVLGLRGPALKHRKKPELKAV